MLGTVPGTGDTAVNKSGMNSASRSLPSSGERQILKKELDKDVVN